MSEITQRSMNFSSLPPGAKVLWVASGGGHISEAIEIDRVIASDSESVWVTFDTPQTEKMLEGRRTVHVDYVAPRDALAALRAANTVSARIRGERFDACISTGAAVALGILPMMALRRIPTFYVESVARISGPSMTGRMLRRVPSIVMISQSPGWGGSWRDEGSVLDSWERGAAVSTPSRRRVLVTLGTIRPYRFDRAVDAVLAALRPDDDVVWQVGATTGRSDLPGEVIEDASYDVLQRLVADADVVVSHAGVGSALQAYSCGKLPVLAVRSAEHGEHVDDHQHQLARALLDRGIAVALDFFDPEATRHAFEWAARSRILLSPDSRRSS